jgi:hypothetical protein
VVTITCRDRPPPNALATRPVHDGVVLDDLISPKMFFAIIIAATGVLALTEHLFRYDSQRPTYRWVTRERSIVLDIIVVLIGVVLILFAAITTPT